MPFPPQISSGIYKIAPDGAPEELWASRDDVVYSLGIGGDGRLLAGLGNSGALLAIDGKGVFAQLAKAGSAQITGIARNSTGKIFLCTANPGKLIALGPEYEPEGNVRVAVVRHAIIFAVGPVGMVESGGGGREEQCCQE